MPLTVGTDSYISLADAVDYLSAVGKSLAGDADAQEAALRRATMWVDGTYRARFPGTRTDGRDQLLEWPRTGASDVYGTAIPNDEIPREIVNATAEAAVREATTPGGLMPDVTPGQLRTLTRVGSLGWTPQPGAIGAAAQKPVILAIDSLLSSLIGGSGNASTTMLLRS